MPVYPGALRPQLSPVPSFPAASGTHFPDQEGMGSLGSPPQGDVSTLLQRGTFLLCRDSRIRTLDIFRSSVIESTHCLFGTEKRRGKCDLLLRFFHPMGFDREHNGDPCCRGANLGRKRPGGTNARFHML